MPVERSEIDAQLREIGEGERWWEHREFRSLPYVLHPGERITGIVTGRLLGMRRPRLRSAPWLLVATDQRLLCLKQERFARKQVELAAGQIVRVQQSSGLRRFQITVYTAHGRYRIRIAKDDALRFSGALAALTPDRAVARLPPALEPWAWLPGITRVAGVPGVAGLAERISMLSPPDYANREHFERLESTVERLQHDVERLQQQVAFLEELLQKRSEHDFLTRLQPESAE